ncbi:MucR family transcriptional regulator [Candidatus Entotheonella palauensis]|uniref:MucR family transcriptional regulator n=1 Tax=Candidatus Entotheonella palauensis TaxID=93172 RepID=UPI000B7E71C5
MVGGTGLKGYMDGKGRIVQEVDGSIQQEKVICLECGKVLQLLSHRHLATHGLTPRTYKRKHGLCLTQSLCTHELARRREALAKNLLANGGGTGGA